MMYHHFHHNSRRSSASSADSACSSEHTLVTEAHAYTSKTSSSAFAHSDHPTNTTTTTTSATTRPSIYCYPQSSQKMNRRSISDASERSCEGLTAEDTRELWRCMLELQGLYGCYTSARIDVAMEAGEQGVNLMRESPHIPMAPRHLIATDPNLVLHSQPLHH